MMKIPDDEKTLDTWMLNYITDEGRYFGLLVITNESIYFEGQYQITMTHNSLKPIEGGFKIPKSEIKNATKFKKFFIFQRVKLELMDGSIHIFDRGAMPVQPIMDCLKL